jgi:hypothetical protein
MKTTIEISDDLLERSRKLARQEGLTLRALVEEGLRMAVAAHRQRKPKPFRFPVYGKGGMSEEFRDGGWESIRDEIYRGRGS